MIDFELEPQILSRAADVSTLVSEHMMRPISRECDEHEHTKPTQFYESMWAASRRRRYPGRQRPQQEGRWRDASLDASTRNLHDRAQHRGTVLGRRRPVPVDPQLGPRRRGGHGGGNAGAEGALPQALQGRQAEVGRDGDHRARLRFRFVAGHHHRDARRRPLGDQRHQDLLHRGRDGGREVRRLRRGVGDGRQERGTPRHQAVRRRAQHARHDRGAGREQTRHPRVRHRRAHLRQLPHSARRICSAAPRFARKAASRT